MEGLLRVESMIVPFSFADVVFSVEVHFACSVGWTRVADTVDGCNQSGMPFSGSMKSVVTNGTNYQALVRRILT